NVNIDPSDLTRLQSINVAQVGGAAEPTTRIGISANLQSSQPLSAQLGSYNSATNSMAMYDPDLGVGVRPDFSMQVPVSDSKGGKRTIEIDFLRSATPNQWYAEVRAVPAGDVTTGAGLTNGQLATGTVAFTQDGRLDPANTTLFPDANNPTLTFGASNDPAPAAGRANWASTLGINGQ